MLLKVAHRFVSIRIASAEAEEFETKSAGSHVDQPLETRES
jgi:hypothetical protein